MGKSAGQADPGKPLLGTFYQQRPQHGPLLGLFTTVRLQLLTHIEQEQFIITG